MEIEKKLRILLLEDDRDDAFLIEETLRKDRLPFTAECVDTSAEFLEALARFKPHVVLSDHGLPGFNSLQALKIVSEQSPGTPFILVTGTVSDEYAVSCLREGADDYILKTNLARLPAAIRAAVKKRALEKLKRKSRRALRKQNEQLSKVNGELDRFVYSISHNLRGPLSSLMGLLDVARDEDKEKTLEKTLGMMHRTMTKLDETLNEILEYSRNARSELVMEFVDWNAIIESSFRKIDYLDYNNEVRKIIHLKADIPFFSDSSRLINIITNLLSNAMVYRSSAREPVVSIEIITNDEYAMISITDNGVGIPEKILPRVWEMFYRGSEVSRGAGLGLYIVQETVIRLRGNIAISSENGQGTNVTLNIPNKGLYDLT